MRRLLLLFALVAGLAVPMAALGEDSPTPAAVAACQAEAAQLGKDAFVAKYGPTEPFGHCFAAHGGATTTSTTTTTPQVDPATAACRAEYLQLGADAFKAKYGAEEAMGACIAAHRKQPATTTTTTTTPTPTPKLDGPARSLAEGLCVALAKQLGRDAFTAKFGKEPMHACAASMAAQARSILASCTANGATKDAVRSCIATALGAPPKRR